MRSDRDSSRTDFSSVVSTFQFAVTAVGTAHNIERDLGGLAALRELVVFYLDGISVIIGYLASWNAFAIPLAVKIERLRS